MKIYKEKQFLIFDFENGQCVKYDFATKTSYGKSGREVNDLRNQLRGLSINELCDLCQDKNYGRFLDFVRKRCGFNGCEVYNIGTVLKRVPFYSEYEQLFSAGLQNIDSNLEYSINDIPKGLIKLCRQYNLKLSNMLVQFYNELPNAYATAFNIEYMTLNHNDIYEILTSYKAKRGTAENGYHRTIYSVFNALVKDYGYNAKALLLYLDFLVTYEALTCDIIDELYDYCVMVSKISPKFDKYPRHFLTTHKIACRNYNRLKQNFDEIAFKERISPNMECTIDGYSFIYPKSIQEIKDEAVAQHNCVASYISRVIDGQCHILFLRNAKTPEQSLCTIEVRDNRIVQAKLRFNDPVTTEIQNVIDKWNQRHKHAVRAA